jgi:Flp pilus assembly protein TadG
MRVSANSIWRNESGAIASIYALVLPALIVSGGVAFDYTRMAAMDTELQNAADQAALAAASQLDGQAGATQRAENAANTLVANNTVFSNDGNGVGVTIAEVTFFSCESEACKDDKSRANMTVVARDDTDTADDSAAKYVEVTVGTRKAFYALTPIVGAISSGDMDAEALAGLGSAICRVPPIMMCNPAEPENNKNELFNFDADAYEGAGVRLVANDGGGGYGPGVFGFLETGAGSQLKELRASFGNVVPPGDCVAATGVDVSPGNVVTVRDALNVRFDVYDNGSGLTQVCNSDGSLCPPAANTRKDIYISGNNPAGHARFQSGNGNAGNIWRLPNTIATQHYPPSSLTTARTLTAAEIALLWPMGYPRDICHSVSITGTCAEGRIGNKNWDRNAYFRSNSAAYPTLPTNSDLTNWFGRTDPTRYDVYRWETDNFASRLVPQSIPGLNGANARTARSVPIGRDGIVPSDTTVDRRRLSVAVINCEAEEVGASSTEIDVLKWIDVFLTEPTVNRPRSENGDIYVEIIGETEAAGGAGTAGQVVRRDAPYLIE